MTLPFNNPDVHVQSWYVAMPSRRLRRGAATTLDLLGRKIVFFRGTDGTVRALDARCPHLGADLGLGTVTGDRIRCAFHGWSFDGGGRCAHREARAFAYPVEERYGAIWFFNGETPSFGVPSFESPLRNVVVHALRRRLIHCHPHLIACNGLDLEHFATLHDITLVGEPHLDQPDAFRTRMRMRVRLSGRGWMDRLLRPLGGGDVPVAFTTWGGNAATIEGSLGRVPLRVLFTHRPVLGANSLSRTFVFVPTRVLLPLVLLVLARIVTGDRELLDRLDFRPNLTSSDWPLAAFIRQVNAMPVR